MCFSGMISSPEISFFAMTGFTGRISIVGCFSVSSFLDPKPSPRPEPKPPPILPKSPPSEPLGWFMDTPCSGFSLVGFAEAFLPGAVVIPLPRPSPIPPNPPPIEPPPNPSESVVIDPAGSSFVSMVGV